LEDYTFAAATELIVLNVSENLLNELSDSCFYGLAALEVLDVSANCITCLPNELFAA
jgi:Leucine rich repeat